MNVALEFTTFILKLFHLFFIIETFVVDILNGLGNVPLGLYVPFDHCYPYFWHEKAPDGCLSASDFAVLLIFHSAL